MMTASVEMDMTLGEDNEIGNQICILVATQGNGTPLCPSSFKEEDAVSLCTGLGQEHPKGVLWLLDTKTILAFQCDSNLMAAAHHLTAAMVLWGKPLKLCILPQKGRQVKDYIAVRSSYPSSAQTHVQGMGWIPNLSTACPAWTMGPRWN